METKISIKSADFKVITTRNTSGKSEFEKFKNKFYMPTNPINKGFVGFFFFRVTIKNNILFCFIKKYIY